MTDDKMNILLVRRGDKYSWRYVVALEKQIRHYNSGVNIITLTDQDDNPGQSYSLKTDWPGWWAKLELASPWNRKYRPALYIDLDSFVLGDITRYNMGDDFYMVEDFNGWVKANSSVMWLPKDMEKIWKPFSEEPQKHMDRCGGHGDQKYFGEHCNNLWKTPDDGIVSYKAHGKEGPVGNIMQFHGRPKQSEAGGWAEKYWDRSFGAVGLKPEEGADTPSSKEHRNR